MFKASKRKVGRTSRIAAFVAKYADAHMRLLDHRHVIGTVANRCSQRLIFARLDQSNDLMRF